MSWAELMSALWNPGTYFKGLARSNSNKDLFTKKNVFIKVKSFQTHDFDSPDLCWWIAPQSVCFPVIYGTFSSLESNMVLSTLGQQFVISKHQPLWAIMVDLQIFHLTFIWRFYIPRLVISKGKRDTVNVLFSRSVLNILSWSIFDKLVIYTE